MKKLAHYSKRILFWVVGSFLYSVAINSFCVPNSLVLGGLSGVATIINHLLPFVPIGAMIIAMNIPLFIAGYLKLGKEFILSTAVTTILSSVFIDVFAAILPTYTANKMLAAVAAGVVCGAGLAAIFANGATTGGIDIPAKILAKRFRHLGMGRLMLAMDGIVILLTFIVYRSFESAVYSGIIIFISTKIIDSILFGISNGKIIFAVTTKAQEIYAQIGSKLERGATIIPVKGAYTNGDRSMLFCSVRTGEISRIYEIIESQDKNAFITVADARDIIGEGFKGIDE